MAFTLFYDINKTRYNLTVCAAYEKYLHWDRYAWAYSSSCLINRKRLPFEGEVIAKHKTSCYRGVGRPSFALRFAVRSYNHVPVTPQSTQNNNTFKMRMPIRTKRNRIIFMPMRMPRRCTWRALLDFCMRFHMLEICVVHQFCIIFINLIWFFKRFFFFSFLHLLLLCLFHLIFRFICVRCCSVSLKLDLAFATGIKQSCVKIEPRKHYLRYLIFFSFLLASYTPAYNILWVYVRLVVYHCIPMSCIECTANICNSFILYTKHTHFRVFSLFFIFNAPTSFNSI